MSRKNLERRKQERMLFPSFYAKHVNFIKEHKLRCAECGERLIGDVSEVAHILNKSIFKSVSTEDENIIYLCGWKSGNNCHSNFDNYGLENFKKMLIYHNICDKFLYLKEIVKEDINFKTMERFTKDG
ncbi:MAG: hypothetical protein KBH21_00095 [Acetoanaerobium sp.]|nr:hypothetical protein [Acetoanaerobium sp.]